MNKVFFNIILILFLNVLLFSSCNHYGEFDLHVYSTNDVHGMYFDSTTYGSVNSSSYSKICRFIKNKRALYGEQNVVLVDAGDIMQGTSSSYYFNYIDSSATESEAAKILNYIKYDAVIVGNHDIEAGHRNYDMLNNDLNAPLLAANAVKSGTEDCYFKAYTIIKRGGLKIAIIGMTNSWIKHWVGVEERKGIEFLPIYPLMQSLVDDIRSREKPDLVFLVSHSGFGDGSKENEEQCSRYVADHVRGLDGLFIGHDHIALKEKRLMEKDTVGLIESGSRANYISETNFHIVKDKQGITISSNQNLISLKDSLSDEEYDKFFYNDFLKVKKFSNKKIGSLLSDIDMSLAAEEQCPYLDLIHSVQLDVSGAQISITAPTSIKGYLPAKDITYNDLFKLYVFENTLKVVKMTGEEITKYLNESYSRWNKTDNYYNWDSAAGINYEVSRSRNGDKKVNVLSMADGSRFYRDSSYTVAMTSYRLSGGGDLLKNAGIRIDSNNTIAEYGDIRELIGSYFIKNKSVDPSYLKNKNIIGTWNVVE